mmetsp:Transcript_74041/g.154405  ORF Transcript_74041/g.154405 Transcript_74041/m.154405 type:complete len:385 (-) Transcript_74041:59-1213(-)
MAFRGGFGGPPPYGGGGGYGGGGKGSFAYGMPPPGGGTGRSEQLTGMVKSYNRKGFGFIMCQSLDVDVYFSRESLAPALQTSDLAGEYVTFEVFRFSDGKMQARNLRPLKGDCGIVRGPDGYGGARGSSSYAPPLPPMRPPRPASPVPGTIGPDGHITEDRSLDWYCKSCGERNFTKRFECFKCKGPRPVSNAFLEATGSPPAPTPAAPAAPRRTLSPHAGSRAMREQLKAQLMGGASGGGDGDASGSKRDRSKSSSSSSRRDSSSSSESSSDRKKKKKRRKDKSKSSSSSSSSSRGSRRRASSSKGDKEKAEIPSNPEIEKAKSEVLEKLMKIKQVEPKEQRIKDWRALLREWHPDKNPDKTEVATAVFQFLQKGKLLIDAAG